MKKTTLLAAVLLVSWTWSKVCDQAYHFNSGYQIIQKGDSVGNLQNKGGRTNLDRTMGGAAVLNDEIQYKILTDFTGGAAACSEWTKATLDYAHRKKGDAQFKALNDKTLLIRLFDGDYPNPPPLGLEYWFGAATSVTGNTAQISEIIGKPKTSDKMQLWYGAVTVLKRSRSSTGVLGNQQSFFYQSLLSHPDSAGLRARLLDVWRKEVNNDTQKVDSVLAQFIHVYYDSLPSPGKVVKGKGKTSGFRTNQSGSLMFIQPGEKNAELSQAITLYNMFGMKVATLHPTGYLYQWNGKTSAGTDAPMGVYFVQSGDRILGKFFYSR